MTEGNLAFLLGLVNGISLGFLLCVLLRELGVIR